MIKAERQDKVRQLLEEQGTVSVKEISDALGVSDMTIRRDLEELASLGEDRARARRSPQCAGPSTRYAAP